MKFKKRWTGATSDEVMIAKANKRQKGLNSGGIKRILVTNGHASNGTLVRIYIDDGTNEYNLLKTTIPAETSLILDDFLSYNGGKYDLKITLATAGYDITVMIK